MLTEMQVRAAIGETIDGFDETAIAADEDLSDAGIDSLDQVKVLMRIEELYGLTVADGDLALCSSIERIVAYFQPRSAAAA